MGNTVEALAERMFYACSDWDGLSDCQWCELPGSRKQAFRLAALAACEFFFGKDAQGNVIVPEEGAVGVLITQAWALVGACAAYHKDRDQYDRMQLAAMDLAETLRALGGK